MPSRFSTRPRRRRNPAPVPAALALLVLASLGAVGGIPSVVGPPVGAGGAPPGGPAAGAETAAPPPSVGSERPLIVAPAFLPGPDAIAVAPLPASTPLTVLVGIGEPDLTALAAQATLVGTPGAGAVGRALAPAQVADELGASPAQVARAEAYFGAHHLTATASADHFLITVTGPSADVAAAFGTEFEEYRFGGRLVFSHPTAATLPAGLPWYGALGLGNLSTPLPGVAGPPAAAPRSASAVARPSAGCASGGGALPPCAIWNAYDYAGQLGAGDNGSGVTVAVVDSYDSAYPQASLASDFSQFTAQYGLSGGAVTYAYPVPAGDTLNTTASDGWADEDALDLQWARASAPGDRVLDTLTANSNAALYSAVDWIVAGDRAQVISLSWGEQDTGVYNAVDGGCAYACNASSDGSYGLLHPVLMAAAAEGITVLSASGDCGASDGTSGLSTDYPASDPYVTGVGGTVLSVNPNTGAWVSETGWSGNSSGASGVGCVNQGGSGGGYSPFVRPSWQAGTGIPLSERYRGVPDVALNAGTSVSITFFGSPSAVAGTSAATPAWAGIVAVGDQYAGRPLGYLNPTLYQILRNGSYGADFHDITQGSNGYPAGIGWDPVTGLGTPIVAALLPDLARGTLTPSNLSVEIRASASVGPAPLQVDFTATASGGETPYGAYDFDFGDGNATYTTLPYATHAFVSAGVYNATVLLFDASGNSSLAVPVVIVVGGGHRLNVTLTASSTAPSLGGNVSFLVAAAGGTAPYQYWILFGDGTSTVPGSSTAAAHTYRTVGGFCAWAMATDTASPPDGGGSPPLSIAVGGAARPVCGSGPPPVAHLSSAVVAADLPGDLPLHVAASGGVGALTTWIDAGDPYATACQCGIFRTAGPHEITLYANDSLGATATAHLNVTLYPALRANFTASTLDGPAPLRVTFSATAVGGQAANAARTVWQFGNGTASGQGASVSYLYTVPGEYLATASLMDQGGGNASSAFLIDVTAAGSAAPGIAGTISSAVRSLVGAPVEFQAVAVGAGGPVQFRWNLSDGSSGFGANLTESPIPTGCTPGANCSLAFALSAATAAGAGRTVTGTLPDFFGAAYSALDLAVTPGPGTATTPYRWNSTVNASGLPGISVTWSFGDGSGGAGPRGQHVYLVPGNYTVAATVGDPAGDAWVSTQAVHINGSRIQPLAIVATPSSFTCYTPCLENFSAQLSGGAFPPFRINWSFGAGPPANGTVVTHLFATSGPVAVWANATDGLGEVATDLIEGSVLAPTALLLTLNVTPAAVDPGGIFHIVARSVPVCPAGSGAGCPADEPTLRLEVRIGDANGSGLFAPLLSKQVPLAPPGFAVSMSFPAPPLVGRFWFALVPESPAYTGAAIEMASVNAPAAAGSAWTGAPASAALGLIVLGAVGGAAAGTAAIVIARRDDPEGEARRSTRRLSL